MSKKKETADFADVAKRLDVLLNVILSLPSGDGKQLSMLRRVELLSSAGTDAQGKPDPLLRNLEIARILGVSPGFVAVMMNKLRKKTKKVKKKTAKKN
jgi:hypothetical protein